MEINLHKPVEAGLDPVNKSSENVYLENLQFDPGLKKSWLNFFIVNFRVVILLLILISAWGIYSFQSLPRESSPEVKIPMAVVMTVYPGASPADVEELVTKKIETKISGIKDIDKITSKSSNSISAITVEFSAKANLDDSLRKLRDEVNGLKGSLPDETNDPVVQEVSLDDTPILNVALAGPYDGFALRQLGEDIQDELKKIPGAREVNISGGDETEFEIAYDPQKLASFNLSADSANSLVAASNLAIPAGTFKGTEYSYPVRVDGRFFNAEKLGNTPLFHTGEGAIVYLKDVAAVKEKAIEKTVYSRLGTRANGSQDDITIQIVKKTGGSILDTVDQAKATLDAAVKKNSGLTYEITYNAADQIDEDFNQLAHDLILTLILVFTVLFLIVGFKEALVAGLAIPLVFFVSFGVMMLAGISLNFLSLFSLILALGLLVDDAIVVVSAIKQYLRTGKFTPEEAVLLVFNDFKTVLTTTTLTTVWAFLPLLMASGIIGEFIKSIPITVSVTLISSLIIAFVINHPLTAALERVRLTRKLFSFFLGLFIIIGVGGFFLPSLLAKIIVPLIFLVLAAVMSVWYFRGGRNTLLANSALIEREWQDDEFMKAQIKERTSHQSSDVWHRLLNGVIHFDRILPYYEKYLRRILATKRSRLLTLGVVFVLLIAALALPATGVVTSEFFPPSDSEVIYVNIEAPSGLKLEESDKIARQVEEKLFNYPEIVNFSTLVGQSSSEYSLSGGSSSSHLSSITVKLTKKAARKLRSYQVADKIRNDLSSIQGATITVESPSGGPPSGSAFEAHISGDDLQVLDKTANELEAKLTQIPEVASTNISLKESPADYTFDLDQNRMELYGLNAAYIGSTLRMAISGTEVTTVLRDGKEIKVTARFDKNKIPSLESIQNLQIINLNKQPVFLKDVAKIELKPSVETITRIDQKRTVILSAGLKGGGNSNQVLKDFQSKIKDYRLPDGYTITYGGENEQSQESVMSIIKAMAVAFILIVSTLVVQFNSFKKALIVLTTIPLALIGVFFGLAIAGINLSFPGLIGILALFGIVVKNAIILVDKIGLNLKSGIPFAESIIDAGKSRLEAIFITSICTILGILPITLSNEMWQALGGSIIFGLMLSSFLTLFIVPTLYMTFIRDKGRY